MAWRDRVYDLLAQRIASDRFRQWAASRLILRPIARASAARTFDLCAGFVYTQTLYACIRLGLLERVSERPRTLGELSRQASMPRDGLEVLLRAACALGLLRARRDGTYGLGLQGAVLIDNPGLAEMIEHNALLYADAADPIALLRKPEPDGALADFWRYRGAGHDGALERSETEPYSRLMAASQAMVAEEVLHAYPFGAHRVLLDVGGGDGAFARAAVARWPHLLVRVFDLPSVAGAQQTVARSGSGKIQFLAGDFLHDPLVPGADIVTLVRILHDHDEDAVLRILSAVARALPPEGVVLVAEPMRGSGTQARVADAYFGFYLRAMGRGRARSADEIGRLLERAGFKDVHRRKTKVPLVSSVLVGKRKE
jgi:demethylspheroidene O-methyltransferase